jgi:transcriptional regulator with XRE-family HTH domain
MGNQIMTINCPIVKQHIAKGVNYHDFMLKDAKSLLSQHLRVLMNTHPRLRDRLSVAKAAGISPRTVGNMLQRGNGNPTLAHIEAVADAFGVRAWELLIDRDHEKEKLMEKVFAPGPQPDPPSGPDSPLTLHQPRRPYKQ